MFFTNGSLWPLSARAQFWSVHLLNFAPQMGGSALQLWVFPSLNFPWVPPASSASTASLPFPHSAAEFEKQQPATVPEKLSWNVYIVWKFSRWYQISRLSRTFWYGYQDMLIEKTSVAANVVEVFGRILLQNLWHFLPILGPSPQNLCSNLSSAPKLILFPAEGAINIHSVIH